MKQDNVRRILHTMLRISDITRSIRFYTELLGMKVLRTFEQPEENYTLIFLGYTHESRSSVLELTYNHGQTCYEAGNAYGHIAIGVTNIQETVAAIKKLGGQFLLEPTRLKGSDEIIAFLKDPDGYQIELIERPDAWFR
ncbi:MAG: lactoylglutathione lyase [Gammaproteobacteria bacterium]